MKSIYIVLISLVLLNFFGLFNITFLNYAISVALLANFVWMAWMENRILRPFNVALSLILLGLVISGASSYYYENTKPMDSFTGSQFIISIFYFAVLERFCPSREDVEDALVKLAFLMCGFYILQFIAAQFGITWISIRGVDSEQGLGLRLRMAGSALSAFAYFYGLCKLWNKDEEHRVRNMLLVGLGAVVILLMAFRTMVFGLGVVTVFLAIRILGFNISILKNVLIGSFLLVAVANIPIVQEKIEYMNNKMDSKTQTFANKDYVRWLNLTYHYNGFFKNNTEMLLGSGISASKGTEYRKKIDFTNDNHLMYVDWGILGLSWMVGVITVFGMLFYCWKVLRTRYDTQDTYIAAFFLYLLLVSVLTNEFARPGNFVIQALMLYLAYDIYYENQEAEELDETDEEEDAEEDLEEDLELIGNE